MQTAIELPDSPCLLLDLDVLERNMARMHQTIVLDGGKRWRPHAKALRAPALVQRLQAAGADGVTCATVGEAEAMVAAGIHDVLIASQVVGNASIRRLVALNRQARVMAAVDAMAQVQALATVPKRVEHIAVDQDGTLFAASGPDVYQLKFVIDSPADFAEARRWMDDLEDAGGAIDRRAVFMMPQGRSADELATTSAWLRSACREAGVHLAPRHHVAWFGTARGT